MTVSLASLVATIKSLIDVIGGIFVNAILGAGLEGIVVVVNPVLANVTAEIAVILLDIALVVGGVSIVASILVDVTTHILVGAISVASDTSEASLLADILAVLVGFAAVASVARVATTIGTDTRELAGRLASITSIATVATVATLALVGARDSSLFVSLVEGLEALTALGKAHGGGVGIELLSSAGTIVTDFTVELRGSSAERSVGKNLISIAIIITAVSRLLSVGLLTRRAAVLAGLAIATIGALLLPSGGCDRECSGDSEFAEHVDVGGIGFDYSYQLPILLQLINLH